MKSRPCTSRNRLEDRKLVVPKAFEPSSPDNLKAWAAIEPMLTAAGSKGVRYEQLMQAAKVASSSVGRGFVSYLVRMGVLEVLPI